MYDLIIIGAGPAGLSAAITAAAHCPGLKILILEKEKKYGRKLSASGNGKCNVTNAVFEVSCYHGQDFSFVEHFVSSHNPQEVISFFEGNGIYLYERSGYYYPISNQAKQVTELLVKECIRRGVTIQCEQRVVQIKPEEHSPDYCICVKDLKEHGDNTDGKKSKKENQITYRAKHIILACGSPAAPALSGDFDGYRLAGELALATVPTTPVLAPIYVADSKLKLAKGVRIDGCATLHRGEEIYKETGQLQFNEDNLSGIAMMNLSCYLPDFSDNEYKDCLWLDLLPELSWDRLKAVFDKQQRTVPDKALYLLLDGFFPDAFVRYLLERLQMDGNIRLSKVTNRQLNRLTSQIKKMVFTPVLKEDYNKAQVSLGGVAPSEINPNTFESVRHRGLYVVGELMDMTGKCGGYNITFAVLSGIAAGKSVADQNP